MKYLTLISDKLGNVPLVECGGIMLQSGQELLVRENIALSMLKHYGRNLIQVGSGEGSLRNGHYQVELKKSKKLEDVFERISVRKTMASEEERVAEK